MNEAPEPVVMQPRGLNLPDIVQPPRESALEAQWRSMTRAFSEALDREMLLTAEQRARPKHWTEIHRRAVL